MDLFTDTDTMAPKMRHKKHEPQRPKSEETRKAGERYGDGDVSRWILLDMGNMGG